MSKLFVLLGLTLCVLGCNNDENCVENPKEDCACIQLYDPVCGCNNKTYGNACEASCANIEVEYIGECKK